MKQQKEPPYPVWICIECGNRLGRGAPAGHVCTVHVGVCDVCGEKRAVTEPRDFNHLKDGWWKHG